jgi:hypothetical protein
MAGTQSWLRPLKCFTSRQQSDQNSLKYTASAVPGRRLRDVHIADSLKKRQPFSAQYGAR